MEALLRTIVVDQKNVSADNLDSYVMRLFIVGLFYESRRVKATIWINSAQLKLSSVHQQATRFHQCRVCRSSPKASRSTQLRGPRSKDGAWPKPIADRWSTVYIRGCALASGGSMTSTALFAWAGVGTKRRSRGDGMRCKGSDYAAFAAW